MPSRCYQTQYTDPTTGDVLMQARWYSPGTGTFRSRDNYAGDLNTPVTLNRYTYAGNNPIRYWDPTGFCFEGLGESCDPAQTAVANDAWQNSPHTKTAGATGTGKSTVLAHCVGKSDCRLMKDVDSETTVSPASDMVSEELTNQVLQAPGTLIAGIPDHLDEAVLYGQLAAKLPDALDAVTDGSHIGFCGEFEISLMVIGHQEQGCFVPSGLSDWSVVTHSGNGVGAGLGSGVGGGLLYSTANEVDDMAGPAICAEGTFRQPAAGPAGPGLGGALCVAVVNGQFDWSNISGELIPSANIGGSSFIVTYGNTVVTPLSGQTAAQAVVDSIENWLLTSEEAIRWLSPVVDAPGNWVANRLEQIEGLFGG